MGLLPSFFLVQVALAPLPPFVASALAEIEVETSIEGAAMFRLHLDLSRTMLGDFDALAFDIFRPLVPIRISLSFGLGLPMTLINGFVREVNLSIGNAPGTARLEVVGGDALGTMMGHVQVPSTWPNMPDGAIAAALFGRHGIIPAVVPTPQTRTMNDTTTTQQNRDSAFLRQLAGRHGYFAYLQPDPLTGLDFGHFKPLTAMLALPPQGVLSIDFGSQTNLRSFRIGNQMLKPGMVISVFPDAMTRAPVPIVPPPAPEPPMGAEPSLMRIIPPPLEIEIGSDAANPGEKLLQARARVAESARTVQASGEVDGLRFARPLLPGIPVMVRGAGRQHSGPYLVTGVSHRIARDGYTQSFQAMRNAVGLTGAELFLDPLAPAA